MSSLQKKKKRQKKIKNKTTKKAHGIRMLWGRESRLGRRMRESNFQASSFCRKNPTKNDKQLYRKEVLLSLIRRGTKERKVDGSEEGSSSKNLSASRGDHRYARKKQGCVDSKRLIQPRERGKLPVPSLPECPVCESAQREESGPEVR